MSILSDVGLVVLGLVVGAYGTLIGAGGGFVLVPVLLLIFPREPATTITSVSLAVVCANATSGSASYYRMRRADYRSGILLAVSTLPGAVLGALIVNEIPRAAFNLIMGVALVAVAAFLVVRPHGKVPLLMQAPASVYRKVVDSEGVTYEYRFNLGLAMLLSVLVGFLSSMLGIGGGIIHVPMLATFFSFPEHVATATSHFVLMFMSAAGTLTHILHGDFGSFAGVTVLLAVGVLIGAPVGARLSKEVGGPMIIRLLAVALGVVGVRLLLLQL